MSVTKRLSEKELDRIKDHPELFATSVIVLQLLAELEFMTEDCKLAWDAYKNLKERNIGAELKEELERRKHGPRLEVTYPSCPHGFSKDVKCPRRCNW